MRCIVYIIVQVTKGNIHYFLCHTKFGDYDVTFEHSNTESWL